MNEPSQELPPITEASVPVPPSANAPTALVKKKRRWWFYALIAMGCLVLVSVMLGVGAVMYWKSLVRTYTTTQTKPLVKVDATPQEADALKVKFVEFFKGVTSRSAPPPPLRITAEEINAGLSDMKNLKDYLRIQIEGNRLRALFSVPLDKTRKGDLKGRFLNGSADLDLQIEDGFLALRVKTLEANGKAIPRWILKQITKRNLAENLERNTEFVQFLQELDSLEIKDGAIVCTPLSARK